MREIQNTPELKIGNLDQLPRGTGAKYLICLEPHRADLPLIAVCWKRVKPRTLAPGRVIVVL